MSESKAAKRADPKQVMDVARPGKATATPTARPVITKPEPVAGDPMLNPADTVSHATKKLEPLHPEEVMADTAEVPADKPLEASESFDVDDDKVVPKDVSDAEALKAQKQAEQADAIDKMIESRQYFLPINQAQRRRTKQLVWLSLGIVLVVGAGWTYLLLDAGLISIPGVSVPTHFFK